MNNPKIRFKNQNNNPFPDWEMKTLGEVFERVTRKNKEKNSNTLTFSAHQGLINQRIYYTKDIASKDTSHYYLLHKGDFAYNKGWCEGYPYGAIKRLKYYEKGVLSTLYICFSLKDKNENSEYFFEYFFETDRINRYLYNIITEGARNHGLLNVAINDFFEKIYVSYPCLEEQQLIGDFFSVIDKKISLLQEKKRLLTLYKKGIMQQIFSQEIRFKDDNGNDFPDWEMKKLGELGSNYNGLTGKTKENFGTGKPFITYKQVFDNSKIDISKFSFVDIALDEKQNKVKFGDVFFTISSETAHEVGFSSVFLDEIKNTEIYLNSFCFGYRVHSFEVFNPYFACHLFRSENFRKNVVVLAQGTTRYNISKNKLMEIIIPLPSLPEQKLIGEFLSQIDQKILLATQELESIQAYKKGLLQQMFV